MSFIIRALGRWLRSWRAGDTHLTSNLPAFKDVPQSIKLTSPDFEHGKPIPIKHAGKGVGDDVSPALSWEGVPTGTKELAIVFEVNPSLDIHQYSCTGTHRAASFVDTAWLFLQYV